MSESSSEQMQRLSTDGGADDSHGFITRLQRRRAALFVFILFFLFLLFLFVVFRRLFSGRIDFFLFLSHFVSSLLLLLFHIWAEAPHGCSAGLLANQRAAQF